MAPTPEVEHEWSGAGEEDVVGVLVTGVLAGSASQMPTWAAAPEQPPERKRTLPHLCFPHLRKKELCLETRLNLFFVFPGRI